ncbi:unnamed protein product [Haemonchus placei]|uniref:Uncharacterized protein n=1 Tax=Haemonchus placei TaxID=6290 RepID=A0A158QN11_HAEPC|nr:unnamed protein product [Haemonchus placei]
MGWLDANAEDFPKPSEHAKKYIHLDHEAIDNCCIEFGSPRFDLPFNVDGKKMTQLHCMNPPIHDLVDIIEKAS